MFERGEKLWLCLCFPLLPLEAHASGNTEAPGHLSFGEKPLEATASVTTEALSHPSFGEKPLEAHASGNTEAPGHLSFGEKPLEATASATTEALNHSSFGEQPLEAHASGNTEAPGHLSFGEKPLEATASATTEALSHFPPGEKPLGVPACEDDAEGHPPYQHSESATRPGASDNAQTDRCHQDVSLEAAQRPVAVLEKQRVLVCNEAAATLGVKAGMGSATARTLADKLLLLERDPGAEQRRLQQLCCWGYSVSPTLYPCREDCLLLEIGSCLRLYGGLEPLLARIESDLLRRGVHYRMGLGPTPKSAVLFIKPLEGSAAGQGVEAQSHGLNSDSRSSSAPDSCPTMNTSAEVPTTSSGCEGESLEARLAPLPLKLLGDFPRQVDALARAGLWTFGDILALPRRALGRRCGREFVHYLEQVLGTAEDRQPVFEPPRVFSDDYWFGYEVKANQELLPAIELLLQAFCRFLRNTQLETRQLEWLLYGINRKIYRFEVCSSQPQTHWQAWYQLTRLKVEQLELDQSIEGVGLASEQLVPGNATSGDLFQQAGQKEPMHSLLDRLKSRLGLQAVSKIGSRDEHLPEFAGYCSLDTRPGTLPSENGELRPFWLMQEPQLLKVFNGQPCWQGRLDLLDGPERIEDNWWEYPVSRDYYVARDSAGLLYWVFRDRLREEWYMQGVFL